MKVNQDHSNLLQQQRNSLNKKNLEVAATDRRLAELRQRLWKKKAALQQKENQLVRVGRRPASFNIPHSSFIDMNLFPQVGSVGGAPQHGALSRVAAVGPYVQSIPTSGSLGRPGPDRPETLVKPTYPDSCSATAAMQDSSPKPPPRPAKPAAGERRDGLPPTCAEQEAPPFDSSGLRRVRDV